MFFIPHRSGLTFVNCGIKARFYYSSTVWISRQELTLTSRSIQTEQLMDFTLGPMTYIRWIATAADSKGLCMQVLCQVIYYEVLCWMFLLKNYWSFYWNVEIQCCFVMHKTSQVKESWAKTTTSLHFTGSIVYWCNVLCDIFKQSIFCLCVTFASSS